MFPPEWPGNDRRSSGCDLHRTFPRSPATRAQSTERQPSWQEAKKATLNLIKEMAEVGWGRVNSFISNNCCCYFRVKRNDRERGKKRKRVGGGRKHPELEVSSQYFRVGWDGEMEIVTSRIWLIILFINGKAEASPAPYPILPPTPLRPPSANRMHHQYLFSKPGNTTSPLYEDER
ncbi:hypothetical protein CEXT_637571 [Caerostris extrusa]|uniref:Uncharacterized protein n=1 Tax=Caerostris extrusa TaxID=172846 RepID=A0AAV4RIK3_CAEEX|nr:hypothetical protein CEXT_637571 [Caerostris extrusa]